MKIVIKKVEPSPDMLRQAKLKKISKESGEVKVPVKYEFNITPEIKEECLEDFHLFCISITRDLLASRFKTNEQGVVTYDIENLETQKTLENLQLLFHNIAIKRDDKLKKLNRNEL